MQKDKEKPQEQAITDIGQPPVISQQTNPPAAGLVYSLGQSIGDYHRGLGMVGSAIKQHTGNMLDKPADRFSGIASDFSSGYSGNPRIQTQPFSMPSLINDAAAAEQTAPASPVAPIEPQAEMTQQQKDEQVRESLRSQQPVTSNRQNMLAPDVSGIAAMMNPALGNADTSPIDAMPGTQAQGGIESVAGAYVNRNPSEGFGQAIYADTPKGATAEGFGKQIGNGGYAVTQSQGLGGQGGTQNPSQYVQSHINNAMQMREKAMGMISAMPYGKPGDRAKRRSMMDAVQALLGDAQKSAALAQDSRQFGVSQGFKQSEAGRDQTNKDRTYGLDAYNAMKPDKDLGYSIRKTYDEFGNVNGEEIYSKDTGMTNTMMQQQGDLAVTQYAESLRQKVASGEMTALEARQALAEKYPNYAPAQ